MNQKKVLSSKLEQYLYNQAEILSNSELNPKYKLIDLGTLYSFLLQELTQTEKVHFPTSYSKSVFVFNSFEVPKEISYPLYSLLFKIKRVSKNKDFTVNEQSFLAALKALCKGVHFFGSESIPLSLSAILEDIEEDSYQVSEFSAPQINLLKGTIIWFDEILRGTKNREYFRMVCETEAYGKVLIRLDTSHVYLKDLIWKFAQINLTDLNIQKIETEGSPFAQILLSTRETLVSLDPNYLIDASQIANTYKAYGFKPELHCLSMFFNDPSNIHLLRGSVVNDLLDMELMGKSIDPKNAVWQTLRKSPFLVFKLQQEEVNELIQIVSHHAITLKSHFIQKFRQETKILEPTFLSHKFGIRGRLDVLLTYPKDELRKDVIELKTSKDPRNYNRDYWDKDGIQATCYNLLLQSAFENRKGGSAILYSSAAPSENPLRDVPADALTAKNALKVRNGIAALNYQLSQNPEKVLKKITRDYFLSLRLFENETKKIQLIESLLSNLSEIESDYFYSFCKFIANEKRVAKLGSNPLTGHHGFAKLWSCTREEKEKNYGVWAYLSFVPAKSTNSLFCFKKCDDRTSEMSTFRLGDFILLYPHLEDGELNPTNHQIVKATIESDHKEFVFFKSMNPYLELDYFFKSNYWAIEHELFESGFDSLFQSLLLFLQADKKKKKLLLGQSAPISGSLVSTKIEGLKDHQNHLLSKALAAEDYFLLQGPPGTGKTKVMLLNLVEKILENKNETVLLLAYTNRAVDEMCESLLSLKEEIPFFRLGYGGNNSKKSFLLNEQIKDKNILEIRSIIADSRIVVSTVLSYLKNIELQSLKSFTTAIIDEASQLIEPQLIGILSQVKRFILIGDEKQLPAVVLQGKTQVKCNVPSLNKIGIFNLNRSLFERLLDNCKENNWAHAFDMLQDQGRMHLNIEEFPNNEFYEGNLRSIAPWQSAKIHNLKNDFAELYSKKRRVLISTPKGEHRNVNIHEAKIIGEIIKYTKTLFGKKFTRSTLGVITPYRAQIAEIRKHLDEELRSLVSVDTVERYQGSQREIIIISFAVNSIFQLDNLPVLTEDEKVDKKLNVALTRSKSYCFLVGNLQLLNQHPIYRKLVQHYESEGLCLSINDVEKRLQKENKSNS